VAHPEFGQTTEHLIPSGRSLYSSRPSDGTRAKPSSAGLRPPAVRRRLRPPPLIRRLAWLVPPLAHFPLPRTLAPDLAGYAPLGRNTVARPRLQLCRPQTPKSPLFSSCSGDAAASWRCQSWSSTQRSLSPSRSQRGSRCGADVDPWSPPPDQSTPTSAFLFFPTSGMLLSCG
jgi:hypothetical protein